MATHKPRSAEGFATLDAFLSEEGVRDAFQAVAVEDVLAFQIEEAMKAQILLRRRLARLAACSIPRMAM